MKIKVLVLLTVAATVLAACGSGSSRKLPENDFLGNIPSLTLQYAQQDSILKAKCKAEGYGISNIEKMEKLMAKYEKLQAEADKKFAVAVAKEKEKLVGKDIPFSVADGLGYEITSFKIVNVLENGLIVAEFTMKITDSSLLERVHLPMYGGTGWILVTEQELDKAGSLLRRGACSVRLEKDIKAANLNGLVLTYKYNFSIPEEKASAYVDFAKVDFIKQNK